MPRPPQNGFKPKNTAVEKAFTSIIEELAELKDLMLQNDNDNGLVIMEEGEDEDLTMEDPEE